MPTTRTMWSEKFPNSVIPQGLLTISGCGLLGGGGVQSSQSLYYH